MATTKLYLDKRNKSAKEFPVKLVIFHKGETALLSMNLRIHSNQWDETTETVINHQNEVSINIYLRKIKNIADSMILSLVGELNKMSAKDIRECVGIEINGYSPNTKTTSFADRFIQFAEMKKAKRTQQIYQATYNRMLAFDHGLRDRTFENINKEWLTRFDLFLQENCKSPNGRNIHLRNIRAVFNDAIDDGITTFYPFRKFKIKAVATPKRSLSVDQLRELFNTPVEDHAEKYVDIFKLIFLLIGINVIDLCHLKHDNVHDGRIEYYRHKTNRLYSIKIEPEAMDIIERYHGEEYLLDIMERYDNYHNYAKRLNEALQRIGDVEVGKQGKKEYSPIFPNITTYWARHTWATIAASIDIPKETIAAALGHGGGTVTDVYIDFDRNKIDEANRKVIDYVFYYI